MLENFTCSVLNPLVQTQFEIECEDSGTTFSAKLVEVDNSSVNGDQWETFRAVFEFDEGQAPVLTEGTYKITHEKIGEVVLFGSPNSAKELEFCCSFARDD